MLVLGGGGISSPGDGNTGMVIYDGDMNDIKDPNWHDWNIALADFNASVVDLTDISKIAIGIGDGAVPGGDGVVYIEDIRLCVPRCILLWRSADFTEFDYAPRGYPYSGDCVIDHRELEIMSEEWLMEPPSDPNVDLHTDGVIDFMDFAILADVWLEDGIFP